MRSESQPPSNLNRLMGHLEHDPANLRLLEDAAFAAFNEGAPDLTAELVARHAAIKPLPPALANLQGLIALAQGRFDEAATIFAGLRARGDDDPALRFNLAWCKAMTGAYQDALDLLDDDAIAASPRGPSLKIQMMQHLGFFDAAIACGKTLAERYPTNHALMGALATLAMDTENPDLALHYAKEAGENDEGRVVLGLLTLDRHNIEQSLALFEQAIDQQPQNPRAWVGKGLGLLTSGNTAEGAKAIDRGAELFNRHIGSWIASGWAHFINGDYAKARASFQRALAIDPNFSESHGGMAVLDIVEGRFDEARESTKIALRLDKNCFGGALAKSLLLEKSGHTQLAQKIRATAMSTPIGPTGQTLAQALVGFSSVMRR